MVDTGAEQPHSAAIPELDRARLLLAGPVGDPLVDALGERLRKAGVEVLEVALDPRSTSDDDHEARYRKALAAAPRGEGHSAILIGGFSIGARIAAGLCPEVTPAGLLCFGYPFHRARQPGVRHGLKTLQAAKSPTLIVQGSRDSHGNQAEVRGYGLPETIELVWLADGNHRFQPRESSGLSQSEHLDSAAAAAVEFLEKL